MNNKFIFPILLVLSIVQMTIAQDLTGVVTHESTTNANDGAIDITVNGGFPPYSYTWNGPGGFTSTNEDINNLAPGQYCVTVSDVLCGTVTYCGIVRRCNPILGAGTTVTCPYNGNGIFSVLVSGQGPFTAAWSDGVVMNGESGPVIRRTGLDLGVYCVTVTNAYGCSETLCRAISQNIQPIQVNGNITPIGCSMLTGSISLGVTGGFGPYTYLWSDNVQSKDRSNLAPGTYCVTVTDAKGCSKSSCFDILPFSSPFKVAIAGLSMITDCFQTTTACDGAINIEPVLGSGPYSYAWTGPNNFVSSQQDISNLCAPGNYAVTVTDANGCTATEQVNICCCYSGEPPHHGGGGEELCDFDPIFMSSSVAPAQNGQGGSINLYVVTGGDYSLVWKKDGVFYSYERNLTNLAPGKYCVTVDNGCFQQTKCFNIVDCDLVQINISGSTQPACPDYPAGDISISVSGGTTPYKFKWSNGSVNQNLNDLTAGQYTVTVTDANGCFEEKTFTVQSSPITIANVECTQITYCGNQIVKVQEFGSTWEFDFTDCRYARIRCANGYVGPWQNVGYTIEYPFGPTGCQINLRCANGQILTTYYGQTTTDYIGGISGCTGQCILVRYCYYPSLNNWIDPNSVVQIGNGPVTKYYYGQSSNCSCCATYCCKIYTNYCDNTFIGYSEECCYPIVSDEPDQLKSESHPVDVNELIDAIHKLHPDYAQHDLAQILERDSTIAAGRMDNRNTAEDNAPLKIADVFPNPFEDQITVKVFVATDQEVQLSLLDINGMLIQEHTYSINAGLNILEFILNGKYYPAGSYVMRLTDASGRTANKLIIKAE